MLQFMWPAPKLSSEEAFKSDTYRSGKSEKDRQCLKIALWWLTVLLIQGDASTAVLNSGLPCPIIPASLMEGGDK